MTVALRGPYTWSGGRTEEGHREYRIVYLVEAPGPAAAMGCPGLPMIGSTWSVDGDLDAYALCKPTMGIRAHEQRQGEPFSLWEVECNYSTKASSSQRCQDQSIENPMDEPDRYGGSFVRYTEQALKDKDGNQLKSLSGHPLAGSNAEFDANRPTVWIEQNRQNLELAMCAGMVDCVNASGMWGLNARCVKLSSFTWERKLYGSCSFYYTRRFEFDVRYDTFDRTIEDWSEFCLSGEWKPDVADYQVKAGASVGNPASWMRYKDRGGNYSICPLTNGGVPATSQEAIRTIEVKKYRGTSFASLGIPASF